MLPKTEDRFLHHRQNILGRLRALFVTDPLICLYTCVCGALSLAGSLFDPRGRWQHGCSRVWSRLILASGGVHVNMEGMGNLPRNETVVLCANHPSAMDIWILLASLPIQFVFVAKRPLFRIPFLGWHLRRSGHIPVDRESAHKSFESLDKAAEQIRSGRPVVLFPEGTRNREGVLGSFKKGSFYLAIKAGVPIIPVTIIGSRALLRPDSILVYSGQVSMVIHPQIATAGLTFADVEALSSRVRAQIASRLPA
jgi:1-acyl-sn-glycerol-3-phosphate acyltransferase